jgi:hypothetical protein
MRVPTSALIGRALDWSVAQIEGYSLTSDGINLLVERGSELKALHDDRFKLEPYDRFFYSPSKQDIEGQSIVRKALICINFCTDELGAYIHAFDWQQNHHGYWRGDHSKPLVAAMRCYVSMHCGDFVDLPAPLYKEFIGSVPCCTRNMMKTIESRQGSDAKPVHISATAHLNVMPVSIH